MSPFHTLDYRKAVTSLIQRQRRLDPKLTYARIAEASGVQPTYFSNVLKGRSHFSSDQLYAVGRFLKLSKPEMEYCGWLLEWERSRIPERRQELKEKIDGIRKQNLRTAEHLKAKPVEAGELHLTEYYLDPLVKIVHTALGVTRYQRDVRRLREALGVTSEHFERCLRVLERVGYLEALPSGGYRLRVRNRHLPEDSPLCLPHQTLMRIRSVEHVPRVAPDSRYQVSVTFTATDEVRDLIRGQFLEFLKHTETLVKGSTEEKVFQLNFDLFPWALTDV